MYTITIRINLLQETVTLSSVDDGTSEVNATQWNNAMNATKFSYEYASNFNAPNQTVYVDNNKMKVIYEDQTVEYMSTEADVVYTYELNGSQWEKHELEFTTFDQITGKFILLSLDFDDFTFNDEYYHAENVLIPSQGTYDVVNVAFNNGVLDYIYLEVDNYSIEMSFLSSNFTIILPQVGNGGNGNNAQGVSVTKNDWESTLWQTKYAINYVMENMEVLAMVDGNKAR